MDIEHSKSKLSDEITPTSKNITFVDILIFILLGFFCLVAAYYGWVYGLRYAPYYLSILQSIGFNIKTYVMRMVAYAQEYARRSR